MKKVLVTFLILVSLLLVFSLQNTQAMEIKFIFWKLELLPVYYIIISGIVGIISGIILIQPFLLSKNRKIDELNSFIEDFREKERQKVEDSFKPDN